MSTGTPTRRGRRAALAALSAALAVLGLAPVAQAAYKPLLTATSTAGGVTISYSQAASNEGAAVLALYAPRAYGAKLGTTPGTVVGTATGNAVAADIRGSTVPLEGTVLVAATTTPFAGGTAATVGDAARACSGSSTSAALWSVTLTAFTQTIQLAIAVQRVDTGPLAGGLALFVCPPPADVPAGTAGRAPLGLKIVHLTLKLTNAFTVPSGTHVWHLRATPYAPGSAAANAAASAEAEAGYALPQKLTLAARPTAAPKRVRVSGRLTQAGNGVAGRTVRLLVDGKQVTTAKTNGSGAFDTSVALAKPRATLVANVVVPARYSSPCTQPAFAPIPCVTSIFAGFSATSGRVTVKT